MLRLANSKGDAPNSATLPLQQQGTLEIANAMSMS
jgi:hypothetical protein